jgi:hypothetical protein
VKPVAIIVLCLVSFLCPTAIAQCDTNHADNNTSAKTIKPLATKLRYLRGMVAPDGKTFTTGKDRKTWRVRNPEVLKGHEGHHRMLSANVYPDKNSIRVVSVIGYKRTSAENDREVAKNK